MFPETALCWEKALMWLLPRPRIPTTATWMRSLGPAARALILRHWGPRLAAAVAQPPDAKTALQEWAQARGLPPPAYVDLGREGPDHAPLFSVEARLADGRRAEGRAPSKRAAQQQAAEALLARLGTHEP